MNRILFIITILIILFGCGKKSDPEYKAENKKGAAKPKIIKPEYKIKSFCLITINSP